MSVTRLHLFLWPEHSAENCVLSTKGGDGWKLPLRGLAWSLLFMLHLIALG